MEFLKDVSMYLFNFGNLIDYLPAAVFVYLVNFVNPIVPPRSSLYENASQNAKYAIWAVLVICGISVFYNLFHIPATETKDPFQASSWFIEMLAAIFVFCFFGSRFVDRVFPKGRV